MIRPDRFIRLFSFWFWIALSLPTQVGSINPCHQTFKLRLWLRPIYFTLADNCIKRFVWTFLGQHQLVGCLMFRAFHFRIKLVVVFRDAICGFAIFKSFWILRGVLYFRGKSALERLVWQLIESHHSRRAVAIKFLIIHAQFFVIANVFLDCVLEVRWESASV